MICLFRFLFFLYWSLCTTCCLQGQSYFEGVSAVYDDVINEWEIYYVDTLGYEEVGELRIKWPFRNDIREWQFDFNDDLYQLRLRFNQNPQHWELSNFDKSITLKQKWRSDPNIWDLQSEEMSLKWQTDFNNVPDVWYWELDNGEFFEIWTILVGDYRDWEVNDQAPSIPDIFKLGAIFISIFQSNMSF